LKQIFTRRIDPETGVVRPVRRVRRPRRFSSEESMTIHVSGIPFNRVLVFPVRNAQAAKRFLMYVGLLLAGFLVPLLPGILASGYSIRMMRKAIQEGEVEMPDFHDGERLLLDGLHTFLITLAYILPGILTLIGSYFFYMVSFFLIIPSADRIESYSYLNMFLPMAVLFFGMGLGIIILFLGAIPFPVALCRFADEGRLGAAFQFREIFGALKRNPVGYLGAWIVAGGWASIFYYIFFIAYMTVCLCCFGYLAMLIGVSAAGLVFMAMVGLAYRDGKAVAGAE
jgi:hypothetical protein